jgi:Aromatic-ring-opening dioxygenase LigAB, LigA subunit
MSLYELQKLIRDVNRKPSARKAYFDAPAQFVDSYALTEQERAAVLGLDIGELYAQGVHGLLLRPFTILHSVSEPDYLKAIRGEK